MIQSKGLEGVGLGFEGSRLRAGGGVLLVGGDGLGVADWKLGVKGWGPQPGGWAVPPSVTSHTLVLFPPSTLVNLVPCHLTHIPLLCFPFPPRPPVRPHGQCEPDSWGVHRVRRREVSHKPHKGMAASLLELLFSLSLGHVARILVSFSVNFFARFGCPSHDKLNELCSFQDVI